MHVITLVFGSLTMIPTSLLVYTFPLRTLAVSETARCYSTARRCRQRRQDRSGPLLDAFVFSEAVA